MLKQKENSQKRKERVVSTWLQLPRDAAFRGGPGVVQLGARFVVLRPAEQVTGSPVIPVQLRHRPCVARGEVQPQVLGDRRQVMECRSVS